MAPHPTTINDEIRFDLALLPDTISDEFASFLEQLVDPDPDRRFRTALAARTAFEGIELGEFGDEEEEEDPDTTRPLKTGAVAAASPYPERNVVPSGTIETSWLIATIRISRGGSPLANPNPITTTNNTPAAPKT